jgi:hypothetical protein
MSNLPAVRPAYYVEFIREETREFQKGVCHNANIQLFVKRLLEYGYLIIFLQRQSDGRVLWDRRAIAAKKCKQATE